MTPSRRRWSIALALLFSAVSVLVVREVRHHSRRTALVHGTPVTLIPAALSESARRDQDIAFYARRAAEDPASAADRGTLAALLFARTRYTGSNADLVRAESLARVSTRLRSERNGRAFELLATVLMTRHAFRDARMVAERADSLEPETPAHLALLGEIELELGEYDAAKAHFSMIHYDGSQFTIGARLARWHELTGRLDLARRVLARAIARVDRRDDLPREQVAWFHYRLGELELRAGRVDAADSAFEDALRINPDDARVLGGLSRVAASRRAWTQALAYGDRATAIQLDPATLGTMSTAYAALGDSAQAASFARAMAVSALKQPGVIHRAWGLFLLDHGTAADRRDVLRRARRELRERHDVYGHDLLAWALFRTGHLTEARAEMTKALAQGTEDVMFARHAQEIGVSAASHLPDVRAGS